MIYLRPIGDPAPARSTCAWTPNPILVATARWARRVRVAGASGLVQKMPDTVDIRVNDVGDILYLRFLHAKIAVSREVDDLRCADYDSEGRLIGVELIGLRAA